MNIEQASKLDYTPVTIVNGDTKAPTEFKVCGDRLHQLSLLVRGIDSVPPSWGDGVDGAAVLGMSFMFEFIPQKFPVNSILAWLQSNIDTVQPPSVVEAALIKLARLYV
jgi:hypothetical protein